MTLTYHRFRWNPMTIGSTITKLWQHTIFATFQPLDQMGNNVNYKRPMVSFSYSPRMTRYIKWHRILNFWPSGNPWINLNYLKLHGDVCQIIIITKDLYLNLSDNLGLADYSVNFYANLSLKVIQFEKVWTSEVFKGYVAEC